MNKFDYKSQLFTGPHPFLKEFVVLFLVCVLIASGIFIVRGGSFYIGVLISLGFGIPCYSLTVLTFHLFPRWAIWINIIIGQGLGVTIGTVIALFLVSDNPLELISTKVSVLINFIIAGFIFGGIGFYIMYSRSRIQFMRAELLLQEQQRLRHEKELVESELRALQAQIEPHFLFNTLANIQALIDSDTSKAKQMLQNFTDLLRSTLTRSRSEETVLNQEIHIVEKYLMIQQQRLGERLRYSIECPEELGRMAFPPLLIQPLVENAVIHGIEPCIDGGRVELRVREKDGEVMITVSDNGKGLGVSDSGTGLGMENTRSRLKAVFGEGAAMSVKQNTPSGVVVELRLGLG